ncbi:hypothetical protein [Selenomonas ruminantium]
MYRCSVCGVYVSVLPSSISQ